MSWIAILLVIALVLFVLEAFGVTTRIGLGWLGCALVLLAYLLSSGRVP